MCYHNIGEIMKRIKRKLLRSLIILLAASALITAAINIHMVFVSRGKILSAYSPVESRDAIIVLGSPVSPQGKPSMILKLRLDRTAEVHEQSRDSIIICSGDNRESRNHEVDAMVDYLREKGLDNSILFSDNDGYCTYDSIRGLLEDFSGKSVIIITQKYHLYRAIYIAHSLGIDATGISAEEIPDNIVYRYFREYFARVKDFVLCVIRH